MIKITGVEVRCDGENCNSFPKTIEFVEPILLNRFTPADVMEILTGWAIWPGQTLCPECKKKQ